MTQPSASVRPCGPSERYGAERIGPRWPTDMLDSTPEYVPTSAPPTAEAAGQTAEALAQVIDDTDDRGPAARWAANELRHGRAFEAVSTDLVGQGWSSEVADEIVEAARQATRDDRGVRTRDAVALGAERRYRRTLANVRWFAFGGLPALLFAARNLFISAKGVRDARRRQKPTVEPAEPARRQARGFEPIQSLEDRRG
ncbi:MAG: hypothetical protein JWO31_1484 [Phycisphaerales bacterium]|nr:hypothetical protein [Phycisphaerales bacterium]